MTDRRCETCKWWYLPTDICDYWTEKEKRDDD